MVFRSWVPLVGVITVLTGCSDAVAPRPSYPGGGQLVVFVSNRDGNYELYSMRPDGTELRRLTNDTARDLDPELSPDQRQIAFSSDREGRLRIYVMDVDGRDVHRVSPDDAGAHQMPTWSPDGRRIAYVSDAPYSDFDVSPLQRIWVMNADGSQARVAAGPVTGFMPKWGPSGRIAYSAATDDGRVHLHTMNPDSIDDRVVVADTLDDVDHAWSPDGRRLVFAARDLARAGSEHLFTVNADGTALTPLLGDQPMAPGAAPVWSPDGTRILFGWNRDGAGFDLYMVRLDGTELHQVTTAAGYDGLASWR